MRFATLVALAAAVVPALAAPTATKTLQPRAAFCGQWDSVQTGTFTLYNNLWGRDSGSGSQCTEATAASGSSITWTTSWSWSGGQYNVKSYANAVLKASVVQLSKIKSMPTSWKWSYSGSGIVANVAYDLFTSSSSTGSNEYEIMIWLGALGGAGPISSTGSPIATVTLSGKSFQLYYGLNGSMKVYSFVASSKNENNFSGNLLDFISYLTQNQGMPTSQYLLSSGAGTEPFVGSSAKLTSTYSLSLST